MASTSDSPTTSRDPEDAVHLSMPPASGFNCGLARIPPKVRGICPLFEDTFPHSCPIVFQQAWNGMPRSQYQVRICPDPSLIRSNVNAEVGAWDAMSPRTIPNAMATVRFMVSTLSLRGLSPEPHDSLDGSLAAR